ncbi:hypothetical protein [Streptomyces mirabilis]|uniref:hypothetical protein n=1 Tax=Streptomyces mirabilis TaxID=68239 RepID=UPI0036DC0BB1
MNDKETGRTGNSSSRLPRWRLRGAAVVTTAAVVASGVGLLTATEASASEGGSVNPGTWVAAHLGTEAFSGFLDYTVFEKIWEGFGFSTTNKTLEEIDSNVGEIQDHLTGMTNTLNRADDDLSKLGTFSYDEALQPELDSLKTYVTDVQSRQLAFTQFVGHMRKGVDAKSRLDTARSENNGAEADKQLKILKEETTYAIGTNFVSKFFEDFGPNAVGGDVKDTAEDALSDTVGFAGLPGKSGNWTYHFMKGKLKGGLYSAEYQNAAADFLNDVYTARKEAHEMYAAAMQWRMAHLPAPDGFNPPPEEAAQYVNDDADSLNTVISTLQKNTPACKMPANTVLDNTSGRLYLTDPTMSQLQPWGASGTRTTISTSGSTDNTIDDVTQCASDTSGTAVPGNWVFDDWDSAAGSHSASWVEEAEIGIQGLTGHEVTDSASGSGGNNKAEQNYRLPATLLPSDEECTSSKSSDECHYSPDLFSNS